MHNTSVSFFLCSSLYKSAPVFWKKRNHYLREKETHYQSLTWEYWEQFSSFCVISDIIVLSASVSLLSLWEANIRDFCLCVKSQKLIMIAALQGSAGNQTVKLWFLPWVECGRATYCRFANGLNHMSQQMLENPEGWFCVFYQCSREN